MEGEGSPEWQKLEKEVDGGGGGALPREQSTTASSVHTGHTTLAPGAAAAAAGEGVPAALGEPVAPGAIGVPVAQKARGRVLMGPVRWRNLPHSVRRRFTLEGRIPVFDKFRYACTREFSFSSLPPHSRRNAKQRYVDACASDASLPEKCTRSQSMPLVTHLKENKAGV